MLFNLLVVSNMYIQFVCPSLICIYSPDADASGPCSCRVDVIGGAKEPLWISNVEGREGGCM